MRRYLSAVIGASIAAIPVQAAETDLERRFGAQEGVTQVSLSPDGQLIAFVAPNKGLANDLYVARIGDGEAPHRILRASGDPETLRWCRWATDARIVCQVAGREKIGEFVYGFTTLIAVDSVGGNVKTLSKLRGANAIGFDGRGGSVIDWQPGTPDSLLIMRSNVREANFHSASLLKKDEEGMGVDLMDLSGDLIKIAEKPRRDAVEYITDGKGKIRIMGALADAGRTGYPADRIRYFFRDGKGGGWQPLSAFDLVSHNGFDPFAVDAESNRAIGLAKIDGRDAVVAVRLDGTGKGQTLFRHPHADVDGLVRVGRDQRVIGATYITDRRQMVLTDPRLSEMAQSLSKALGGRSVYFIDASADEAHWLLWAGADTDPGRYYRYTPGLKQLRPLLEDRPALADVALSPVRPVRYPAADGTMLTAHLTLPPGRADAVGLPSIVIPHGGLADRDEWGFNWLAQYFAQRGYAVMQPDYRGLAGYGEQWFRDGGFQSWRTAIGDVGDAGRWIVAEGADPAKLSIVGWGYGGYAALQSGVVAPSLFRSIVAIAPITDLQKLKEDSTKFSNNLVMQQLIGSGPHLRDGSPAQNAERIQVPVLMVAGGLGHDSTIDQTRVMHGALSTAGKKVELIEYPGVAQDLDDSDVRAEMLRRIAQFLPH